MRKPHYKHHCQHCKYMGSMVTIAGGNVDLYYCDTSVLGGNAVVRHGDGTRDYLSRCLDYIGSDESDSPHYIIKVMVLSDTPA